MFAPRQSADSFYLLLLYYIAPRKSTLSLIHIYFSFPKFWGKGYTTEALRQVLSFAFVQGKVYRMSASCFAENAGSERVLQKCGFTQEAGRTTFRRHGGERKPRVQYRLLKEEWASL